MSQQEGSTGKGAEFDPRNPHSERREPLNSFKSFLNIHVCAKAHIQAPKDKYMKKKRTNSSVVCHCSPMFLYDCSKRLCKCASVSRTPVLLHWFIYLLSGWVCVVLILVASRWALWLFHVLDTSIKQQKQPASVCKRASWCRGWGSVGIHKALGGPHLSHGTCGRVESSRSSLVK